MPIVHETAASILKNQIIDGHYLALSTTEPTNRPNDQGSYNITEPSTSTTTYRRVALGNASGYSASYDDTTKETTITNTNALYFPECVVSGSTTAWGTLPYFAIFASASSTVPLYVGSLEASITPTDATIPTVRIGALKLSLLPDNE